MNEEPKNVCIAFAPTGSAVRDDDECKSEKEAYYDKEIAPKLRAIMEECKDHGFSIVAVCEWNKGETERSILLNKEHSIVMQMMYFAAKAAGNIDAFLMAVMRHARKSGHSSIFLKHLGVPEQALESTKEER